AAGDPTAAGLATAGLATAGLAAVAGAPGVGDKTGTFDAGTRVTVGSTFLLWEPQAARTRTVSMPTTANSPIRPSIDAVLRLLVIAGRPGTIPRSGCSASHPRTRPASVSLPRSGHA